MKALLVVIGTILFFSFVTLILIESDKKDQRSNKSETYTVVQFSGGDTVGVFRNVKKIVFYKNWIELDKNISIIGTIQIITEK